MHIPPIPAVESTDPEIAELIEDEARRQYEKIRLIPSENYVSAAVLEATGTVLTNKYSEGYPGSRYYEGQQFIDQIETLASDRAQGAVRRRPRQRPAVLGLAREPRRLPGLPAAGRHRHGHGAADGRPPHPRLAGLGDRQVVPAGAVRRPPRHRPDRPGRGARPGPARSGRRSSSAAARRSRARSTSRPSPRSPREVGAILVADIAHIAGLIAGGAHPSPVGHADVITTTTHKTLRGPRGAMIMSTAEHATAIDKAVFPGLQGGPHNHTTAGDRGGAARGRAARVPRLRAPGRRQRQGARPRR